MTQLMNVIDLFVATEQLAHCGRWGGIDCSACPSDPEGLSACQFSQRYDHCLRKPSLVHSCLKTKRAFESIGDEGGMREVEALLQRIRGIVVP